MKASNKSFFLSSFFKRTLKQLAPAYFYGIVVILSFLITFAAQKSFDPLGWPFYDWLQKKFPDERSSQVVVINLDNSSLQALAKEDIFFPYPRELWADLLKVAQSHGASAVGFDIIFSEQSVRGPADDVTFAETLRQTQIPVIFPSSHDNSIPAPLKIFQTQNTALGTVNFLPMNDGIYRQQPAYFDFKNSISETEGEHSFPHVVAKAHLKRKISTPKNFIHFSKRIPSVPLFNVLAENIKQEPSPELLAQLKNKVWLIGYSAAGLHDLKSSPIDPSSSGTMILANAIHNLIIGDSGISSLDPFQWALFILSLLVFTALNLKYSPTHTPMGLGAHAALLVLTLAPLSTFAFWKQELWLNPLPVIFAVILLSTLVMLQRIFIEWRERLQFSKLVEHSMSAEMTSLIREGKLQTDRFGEKKNITILFADLAGFTTLSEKLKPEELVEVINSYLDDVVDLIFKNHGYIDKFIGDAVMALWGAPIDDKKQSQHALQTALSFEEMTQNFQRKIKEKYPFDFEVNLITRVGVHTGVAIVGNLGARRRFNYTALGDSVNLASRLEGIGKQYQQLITISGEVIQSLSESDQTQESNALLEKLLIVDEIVVKGKTQPTKIYTSCGDEKVRSRYLSAFNLYQKSQFKEALAILEDETLFGPEKVLRERCLKLLENPTHRQFKNGIWFHDEK